MMAPDEKTRTPKVDQLVAVAAANVAKGYTQCRVTLIS